MFSWHVRRWSFQKAPVTLLRPEWPRTVRLPFAINAPIASNLYTVRNLPVAIVEKLHGSVQKGTLPPELPVKEVYDFVQEYISENESLRYSFFHLCKVDRMW